MSWTRVCTPAHAQRSRQPRSSPIVRTVSAGSSPTCLRHDHGTRASTTLVLAAQEPLSSVRHAPHPAACPPDRRVLLTGHPDLQARATEARCLSATTPLRRTAESSSACRRHVQSVGINQPQRAQMIIFAPCEGRRSEQHVHHRTTSCEWHHSEQGSLLGADRNRPVPAGRYDRTRRRRLLRHLHQRRRTGHSPIPTSAPPRERTGFDGTSSMTPTRARRRSPRQRRCWRFTISSA